MTKKEAIENIEKRLDTSNKFLFFSIPEDEKYEEDIAVISHRVNPMELTAMYASIMATWAESDVANRPDVQEVKDMVCSTLDKAFSDIPIKPIKIDKLGRS